MPLLIRSVLPVAAAAFWISLSEFLRNEALFKAYWIDHYAAMDLPFPDAPLNNAAWGLWSLVVAIILRILISRFSSAQAALLGWFAVFIPMWITIGNLGVLPWGLLPIAVPLSLVEAAVAVWVLHALMHRRGA
jgi:hypothetical protein